MIAWCGEMGCRVEGSPRALEALEAGGVGRETQVGQCLNLSRVAQ